MRIKSVIEQDLFKRMDSVGNSWPVMMARVMLGVDLLESNVQEFYPLHDCIAARFDDLSAQISEMKDRLVALEAKTQSIQKMIDSWNDESNEYTKTVDLEIARQNKIASSWWR